MASSTTTEKMISMTVATEVPVSLIGPDPDQPRRHFDPDLLAELIESIRAEGLLQPVGVRSEGDRYRLIFGERRLRAVQALGWSTIPAVELSRDNHLDVLVLQLVENMTRADLHPIEEAHAFRRLIDAGMPAVEVATRIGKSKSYISHKLSLLTLPDPIGIYLEADLLTEGQVRQLARLKAFYGTASRDYRPEVTPTDWQTWPDEVTIPAAVLAWRPLDVPPGYHLPDLSGPVAEVIARSAKALLRLILAEPQPGWMPAAWWYATMLASFHGSEAGTVNAARSFVERHIDLIASAMVAVLAYGDDPDRWPDHYRDDGWLYLSDLRHAGFASSAEAVRQWIGAHPELVAPLISEDGRGFARPSKRQAEAAEREVR